MRILHIILCEKMTQVALSSEEVKWQGDVWPPEDCSSDASSSIALQGCIVEPCRRLEVRRADVQQGFLKSKKTGDVSAKYTELTLRVQDHAAALALSKSLAQGAFLGSVVDKDVSHFVAGSVVRIWAPYTVIGDLAAAASVSDPLALGDVVSISTMPQTVLAASVAIVSLAERKAKNMSMLGETSMYGVVQGGPVNVDAKGGLRDKIFSAKANLPAGKEEPKGNEVADEEWD